MKFCSKCGAEIADDAVMCAECAAKSANTTESKSDFKKTIDSILSTPDTTAQYTAEDIEGNKILALFAYIGILFLVPLLAAKESKFARFHTNQGIVSFIIGCILALVNRLLAFVPVVGTITSIIVGAIGLVWLVLGIVNAVTGKAKELPLIGGIKILK